jgi:hypothetical protein
MTKTFKHTPKDSMSRGFILRNKSGQRMHNSIAISRDNGIDFNTYDHDIAYHYETRMRKVLQEAYDEKKPNADGRRAKDIIDNTQIMAHNKRRFFINTRN